MAGSTVRDPAAAPGNGGGAPHVVIVGAGFGGLSAAQGLARAPVRVTVVDRTNHHLFQPLLYQVATGALSIGDIAAPTRHVLRRQANATVLMAGVAEVDLPGHCVVLEDGSRLAWDFLVLATGVRHGYFGHPEWEEHAPGLKDAADAFEIRRRIYAAFEEAERTDDPVRRRALLTFVLVGGGPTGVELAGALAETARHTLARDFRRIDPAQARVLLVEAGPRLLPAFPEDLARWTRQRLERLGVEVQTGRAVTDLGPGWVRLGEDRLEAATVLWAAGVVASPLGALPGVPRDGAGRVRVEPDLSVPGCPDAFVVGDLACLPGPDGRPLPGVAQVARQGGAFVARAIQCRMAGTDPGRFRYVDKGNMAVVGRSAAVADLAGRHVTGWPAWLLWLFVHLLFLVGFANRTRVLLQWGWSFLTWQKGARVIPAAAPQVPQVDPGPVQRR